MTEQLYRIEHADLAASDMIVTDRTCKRHGVLVPVDQPHDIRWAWERMANGKEVIDPLGRKCRRRGPTVEVFTHGEWVQALLNRVFFDGGWSEPASPQPGSLEWAREFVADGGAVWNENSPCMRFIPGCDLLFPESGWHPWGDRAWLMALPDGTELKHPTIETIGPCEKQGQYIEGTDMDGEGYEWPIDQCPDSGWDLVRDGKDREQFAEMAEAENKCESVAAGVPHEPLKESVQALAAQSIEHLKDDESIKALIRQQWQQAIRIDTLGAQVDRLEKQLGEYSGYVRAMVPSISERLKKLEDKR